MKFCCLWLVSPIPSWNGNMDRGLVLFWLESFVFRLRIFKVLTGQRFFCSVMDGRKFLSFFWQKNFVRFFLSFICYLGGPSILHRGYNMAAWGYEFYLRVLSICHEWAKRTSERYFQHEKMKFVSPSGHVMFCLFYRYRWNSYIKHNFFLFIFETAK